MDWTNPNMSSSSSFSSAAATESTTSSSTVADIVRKIQAVQGASASEQALRALASDLWKWRKETRSDHVEILNGLNQLSMRDHSLGALFMLCVFVVGLALRHVETLTIPTSLLS